MHFYAFKENVKRFDFDAGNWHLKGMSDLLSLARQQKALGDPSRLRIVRLLREGSLCVCEIESVLGLPQYAVSRQLAVLRQAGVVEGWRKGTWMHYRLSAKLAPGWVKGIDSFRLAWDSDPQIKKDLRRLAKLKAKASC